MSTTPATLVDCPAGPFRWRVESAWREQLLGPDGLRLPEWLAAGCATVVKHGPHRTVYHVALPGLRFYVKHNRVHDVRSWLRQLVRPAKSRIEFDRALAVAARGIPTIRPLAVGERGQAAAESYLLTHALDETEQLSAFLETTLPGFPQARQARVRQRLASVLGAFLAQLHSAGVTHHDLHPGNLLVQLDAADEPSLFLIDLHAVRLSGPLTWPARRANLVVLNHWFSLRASRSDRLRFWRAYCRGQQTLAGATPAECDDLARDLERRTWQSNLTFWRHRDRRCLATNRYYVRLRTPTALAHAVQDLDRTVLAQLLADPDAPFRQPGVKLLKDSRSSTVAELELPLAGRPCRVVYKRFRITEAREPWVALVRRSAALRSWVQGHGLRERCLPTARPLAVLHRRRNGLLHEGYLLTELLPDALDLHAFLARLAGPPAAERRRRLHDAIEQVARLVRELHRRRLAHRDLKAANVLLVDGQPWLIDLVGVSRCRKLRRSRKVQNLARLNASFHASPALSRTDRLRFLRIYLQWGLRGRETWKRWWRAVARATATKAARNRQRGRPLA